MSLCVSSSRAIPVSKNLEEVRSDDLRAAPVHWGAEQKGMASGDELPNIWDGTENAGHSKQAASGTWREAAMMAANFAREMAEIGTHKSIVNRLLEPFLHVNVLVTSCEPGLLNFFGLRLDKAAQPEIRALAEAMWKVWSESVPKKLEPGQWHLPFIDPDEARNAADDNVKTGKNYLSWKDRCLRMSTARCARLSYQSFETGRRSTIEEDLALYERLVGAHPIHASPAEHQATPDKYLHDRGDWWGWLRPELHGNLPGWVQFRKTLPSEAVAPLPEGYIYG